MKTKLLCAILGSLLVCVASALAASDSVTSGKGPKIGTWEVKAKPQGFTEKNLTGAFSTITAKSTNTNAATDSDTLPPPLPYLTAAGGNASYATKQTSSEGIKFESRSKVSVTVTKGAGANASWDVTAADFGIMVIAPTGVVNETATASWKVADPMDFSGLVPNDVFSVGFNLGSGGWDLALTDPSDSFSSAAISGFAGTNLEGWGKLFEWSFWASSGQLGVIQGAFSSNPLLGWDDAAITSNLKSRFSYDPMLNDFVFDSAGLMLEAEITVPEGISSVSVTTSLGSDLVASVSVPDSGATTSLLLLGLGSLLLALRGRIRSTGF